MVDSDRVLHAQVEAMFREAIRHEKGDPLGMFHFGGSTHCLVFRKGVKLDFELYGQTPSLDATNMRLNTAIATVR